MHILPTPVTATDMFLSAVLDELQGLRADLALGQSGNVPKLEALAPASVELREPVETPTTAKTPARRRSSSRKKAST